ncbi:hypothetical protein BGZ50_000325, partial [Haplosporangium sp. Z 11]
LRPRSISDSTLGASGAPTHPEKEARRALPQTSQHYAQASRAVSVTFPEESSSRTGAAADETNIEEGEDVYDPVIWEFDFEDEREMIRTQAEENTMTEQIVQQSTQMIPAQGLTIVRQNAQFHLGSKRHGNNEKHDFNISFAMNAFSTLEKERLKAQEQARIEAREQARQRQAMETKNQERAKIKRREARRKPRRRTLGPTRRKYGKLPPATLDTRLATDARKNMDGRSTAIQVGIPNFVEQELYGLKLSDSAKEQIRLSIQCLQHKEKLAFYSDGSLARSGTDNVSMSFGVVVQKEDGNFDTALSGGVAEYASSTKAKLVGLLGTLMISPKDADIEIFIDNSAVVSTFNKI